MHEIGSLRSEIQELKKPKVSDTKQIRDNHHYHHSYSEDCSNYLDEIEDLRSEIVKLRRPRGLDRERIYERHSDRDCQQCMNTVGQLKLEIAGMKGEVRTIERIIERPVPAQPATPIQPVVNLQPITVPIQPITVPIQPITVPVQPITVPA